jgi:hypothetical protein
MSSERASAVRTACVFGAGVALGCAAVYASSRRARAPAAAAPEQAAKHTPPQPTAPLSLDDEIVGEQLTRNVQFFGREGQQRVCDAFVVVVGLGVRLALPRTPVSTALTLRRAWAATRPACCCARVSAGCASSTLTR